jgi:multiple antibiotic resistance protein
MNAFIHSFLLVYAGLFPIVNPVAGAPIFLGLTRYCSDKDRLSLARRVSVNSFVLLLGSLFVGSHVLAFFGITLPVVRIAGGLVVTAFGWKLLHSDEEPENHRAAGAVEKPTAPTDAFYPLTMPLTVGPGSISVAITLGSQRPAVAPFEHIALLMGAATAGLVAMALTIYVCYRFAGRITSTLGKNGTNVLVRLSAFILMCIGIQIIWSGYSALTFGGLLSG